MADLLFGRPPNALSRSTLRAAVTHIHRLPLRTLVPIALLALRGVTVQAQARVATAPVRLAFVVQPPSTVSGGSRIRPPIRVALLDSAGTQTGATDSVTIALLRGPESGLLAGRLTVAAISGIATFDSVSLSIRGAYTLIATAQAQGVLSAVSNDVTVQVGPAARLGFLAGPTNVARNEPFLRPIQVVVQDSGGNNVGGVTGWPVTVAVSAGALAATTPPAPATAGGAAILGTLTQTMTGSSAVFRDLKFPQHVEGVTLTVTTSTPGIMSAVSAPFAVRDPGPPARLRISTLIRNQPAGTTPTGPTVQVAVVDSGGLWLPKGAPGTPALVLIGGPAATLRVAGTPVLSGGSWKFSPSFQRAGTYRLIATISSGLKPDTSAPFTVGVGAPQRLDVATEPSAAGVDQPVTPAVQVRVVDLTGALVPTASDTIIATLLPRPGATGTLGGTVSVEAINGIANFDNLRINGPGEGYAIIFRSTRALVRDTTARFNVGPIAAAAKLRLLGVPTSLVAGQVIAPAPKVVAVDSTGTVVRTFSEVVTVSLVGGPPGAALRGTTEADPTDGVVSLSNLWLPVEGTAYRLLVKAEGMAADTSAMFDVVTGSAGGLKFRSQPVKYEFGQEMPGTVQVEIVDAGGNLVREATDSIVLSVNPYYPLRGGLAARAVGGVVTFQNLKVEGLPPGRTASLVAASALLPALSRSTSQPFTSTPGKASKLRVASVPKLVNQGQTFAEGVRVEVRDANNYVVAGDNSEITLALSENPGKSTLGGTLRRRARDGVATFDDLTLSRLGIGYTLVASASGLVSDSSGALSVAGPPYRIVFTTQPQDGLRHGPISIALQVQDSLGTPRNAGAVPISVLLGTSPNPRAALSGALTVTAQPASRSPSAPTEARITGLRINEDAVGYQLAASAPKLSSALSSPFTLLRHGSPRTLAFEGPVPVSNPAGTIAPAVTVSVRDSVGNVVETSADQVSLALEANAASATLGGTLVAAAQAGRVSFPGLSVSAPGTAYVLQATSASLEATKSEPFSVVDATAACKLAFTQPPVRATAGAPIAPAIAVAVQRCDGGLIAGATDEIAVTLGGPVVEPGALAGTITTSAAAGTAGFADLSVKKAGDGYTLVARAKGLTPATSAPFSVVPGPPARLIVLDQPENAVAGPQMRGQVRVIVADANGNRVSTAINPIAIGVNCAFKSTSTTRGAVIVGFTGAFAEPSGTCTAPKGPPLPAIRGEATFDLSRYRVRGAASEAHFVFTSPGLADGESGPFTVAPGAPYTLGFEGVVTTDGRRAKVAFDGVHVAVRDSLGNDVGQGNDLIQLSLGAGGGSLGGAKEQRADNGAATFNNLSVADGGSAVTIVAAAVGLANGMSPPFAVASYGKPTRLFFKVLPTITAPDQKFTVRVEVQDDVGNVVDTAHVAVTLSIDNNPANGELRGQGPNDSNKGVVEFRDVRINRAGEGYSLRATAPNFPEAVSAPFTIGTPPPPTGKPPER